MSAENVEIIKRRFDDFFKSVVEKKKKGLLDKDFIIKTGKTPAFRYLFNDEKLEYEYFYKLSWKDREVISDMFHIKLTDKLNEEGIEMYMDEDDLTIIHLKKKKL